MISNIRSVQKIKQNNPIIRTLLAALARLMTLRKKVYFQSKNYVYN